MQELRCPHCGEVFQVDETGYAQLARQVRDSEFDKELRRREQELLARQESELDLARLRQEQAYQKTLRDKDEALAQSAREAERLRERLESSETEKKLAVAEAVQRQAQALSEGEKRILTLENELAARETESRLKEKSLQEQYEEKLKSKDEQIEYYKDFKARQSTKMIGESLEQHCLTQFNTLRMTAFPTAYFEKDNDARTGSKGDFIFRESDESGTEFISIMFEMKNVSTPCWFLCWRSTTSCTTTASWMCRTGTRRCTSCGRSFSSPSSRCCATRRSTRCNTAASWRS